MYGVNAALLGISALLGTSASLGNPALFDMTSLELGTSEVEVFSNDMVFRCFDSLILEEVVAKYCNMLV
jgi:hypothetical protein